MGRPKAIDRNTRDLICGLVGMGFPKWHAAQKAGISRPTLYRTLKKDEAFATQLRQAETQQELRPLKHITDQMPKNFRAATWVLERLGGGLWLKRPPDTVTLADMHGIFGAMIKLLLEGVPEGLHRQRVMANYEKFFQRLGGKKRCSPRVRRAILELELDQQLEKRMDAAASEQDHSGQGEAEVGDE